MLNAQNVIWIFLSSCPVLSHSPPFALSLSLTLHASVVRVFLFLYPVLDSRPPPLCRRSIHFGFIIFFCNCLQNVPLRAAYTLRFHVNVLNDNGKQAFECTRLNDESALKCSDTRMTSIWTKIILNSQRNEFKITRKSSVFFLFPLSLSHFVGDFSTIFVNL